MNVEGALYLMISSLIIIIIKIGYDQKSNETNKKKGGEKKEENIC